MIRLSDIRDSLEGVIPSVIATTDGNGLPNISYLSHVHFVDDEHVALSNQYFSKTAANISANGLATVMVVDGYSGQQHILDLLFERSETLGPIFDRVAIHLAVASREQGMSDMMKLRAVDVYRVMDCRRVPAANPLELPQRSVADRRDHLELTHRLTEQLEEAGDVERALDLVLEGLETMFGFGHTMVLLADSERCQLTTIASRGYDRFGFGSEVAFGSGTIGMAAQARLPVRISDMSRGRRYVSAVRSTSGLDPGKELARPAIASPASQLAVPLQIQGRLVGVVFTESERPFAFGHKDEEALSIIARQLALTIVLSEHQERGGTAAGVATPASPPRSNTQPTFSVRYYSRDGSIFLGDEYLIRGVPGRLLHHFLSDYLTSGRRDFLNKEIRRDRSLLLPDFKDNLETRLILLRRRLEEKGGPVRLVRADRGRLRLDVEGVPHLTVIDEP
ncbi:GAF domain-containing protein [Hoeflea sp.]|uniref:GAF domain-containing protein n=1 Tax=Hoeflea sp. TaxID=1940281 RepID=UPI0019984732|nr:GAF domain-containing protein [Hoeflea sp.]MBC7280078.1 GAF domain-containing protein [Hoeflea sp.]